MIFLHSMVIMSVVALVLYSMLERYRLPRHTRVQTPLFTFVVDPLTFLMVGGLATLLSLTNFKGRQLTEQEVAFRRRWLDVALTLFVVGFWTMEILTYFDMLNMHSALYPDKSGNWFMWNGYLDMVGLGEIMDTNMPTYMVLWKNVLAAALLLAQLPFLLWARVFVSVKYSQR